MPDSRKLGWIAVAFVFIWLTHPLWGHLIDWCNFDQGLVDGYRCRAGQLRMGSNFTFGVIVLLLGLLGAYGITRAASRGAQQPATDSSAGSVGEMLAKAVQAYGPQLIGPAVALAAVVFMVDMLGSLYRYNVQVAYHHDALASALEVMKSATANVDSKEPGNSQSRQAAGGTEGADERPATNWFDKIAKDPESFGKLVTAFDPLELKFADWPKELVDVIKKARENSGQ